MQILKKNVSVTIVKIHTKQTSGFLLDILSKWTAFVKKRVKKGKSSSQYPRVALFLDFHSNSHSKV